ncbi:GIY-YIG nuclease family protein [Novosphingobium sp. TCA1]|nr:GIY-YIG nuclease family protein [Novosphingobium sp. TCA1]
MLNLFQHPSGRTPWPMREERQPCVYILASGHYGTLYIGVTSNLIRRLWQHRNDVLTGLTARYAVHRLVHFELFGDMERAIVREKQLKRWHRRWKINLINAENPEWRDLAMALGLPSMVPGKPRDGS